MLGYSVTWGIERPWIILIGAVGMAYIMIVMIQHHPKKLQFNLLFFSKKIITPLWYRMLWKVALSFAVISCMLFLVASMGIYKKTYYSVRENEDSYVLFLLDISPSMSVLDIQNESRWNVLKTGLKNFLDNTTGLNIGVVVFADVVNMVVPFSSDHEYIKTVLDTMTLGSLGEGTALADAIFYSLNILRTLPPEDRHLVVLADGLQNSGVNKMSNLIEYMRSNDTVHLSIAHIGTSDISKFSYTSPHDNINRTGIVHIPDVNVLQPFASELQAFYYPIQVIADINRFFNALIVDSEITSKYTIQNVRKDISKYFFVLAFICTICTVVIRNVILKVLW